MYNSDVSSFLHALFASDDLLLIRHIESWEQEGRRQTQHHLTYHVSPNQLLEQWEWLCDLAHQQRANQYFGVCPRTKPRDDLATDIRVVRCLWADLDHCSVEEAIQRCSLAGLPSPSLIVISGHGCHLYWRLIAPVVIPNTSKEVIEGIMKGISKSIGGDRTQDLARLLRLPATMNRKNMRNGVSPVPCSLGRCNDAHYPLADFLRLAIVEEPHKTNQAQRQRGIILTNFAAHSASFAALHPEVKSRWLNLLHKCETPRTPVIDLDGRRQPKHDRSMMDFRLLCDAIRLGLASEDVWQQVKEVGKFRERGERYFAATWNNAKKIIVKGKKYE